MDRQIKRSFLKYKYNKQNGHNTKTRFFFKERKRGKEIVGHQQVGTDTINDVKRE